jgi:phage terminase small subunit
MALTGKKRLFADAVIAGKSNKDAAIAAGYSVKTASAAGSRLVKDPEVAKHLKERKRAGRKETAERAEAPHKAAPKFDLSIALSHDDPEKFLMAFMNDLEMDPRERKDAAKALMPYKHQKLGEGGKKDAAADAAKKAAGGKFAPTAPPKLIVNNRK